MEIATQHLSNNLNFSKDSVFAEGLSPGSKRVMRIVSRGPARNGDGVYCQVSVSEDETAIMQPLWVKVLLVS